MLKLGHKMSFLLSISRRNNGLGKLLVLVPKIGQVVVGHFRSVSILAKASKSFLLFSLSISSWTLVFLLLVSVEPEPSRVIYWLWHAVIVLLLLPKHFASSRIHLYPLLAAGPTQPVVAVAAALKAERPTPKAQQTLALDFYAVCYFYLFNRP